VNPYIREGKIWLSATHKHLFPVVQKERVDILNRFGVTHDCDRQTDVQTRRWHIPRFTRGGPETENTLSLKDLVRSSLAHSSHSVSTMQFSLSFKSK